MNPDIKVREECNKVLKKFKNPIEILFNTFDSELKNIDDKIISKTKQAGFSYFTPDNVFIAAYLNNPKKIRLHTYIGNKSIPDVKRLKGSPQWGIFILEREEDLQKALDIAKTSFEMRKGGEISIAQTNIIPEEID